MTAFASRLWLVATFGIALSSTANAQLLPDIPSTPVQTSAEAIAEDAAQYARRNDVDLSEAVRRLRAQEESVAETDRIGRLFARRLAGISIEHLPEWRIVVLLTGSEPVPDRTIVAGGMEVPILFRTGAAATRVEVIDAIVAHRRAIVSVVPNAQGMGLDPRTGELVVLAPRADREERLDVEDALSDLTGVPVRVRRVAEISTDFAVDGGTRVVGVDPRDGRRYKCTTGFVVADATRTGIVTAAHCPDALTQYDPAGNGTSLEFVGQWGVGYQDVQVHVGGAARAPLFHADTARRAARTLTGSRRRESTRAGDAVCHRGESSGYSCSHVELTDYAPPGDLCAGPCDPVWTTVTGPRCRAGDSGGPIFNGTVAFGITKGGGYGPRGACGFYYYMSTDYLPAGWRLLFGSSDDSGSAVRDSSKLSNPFVSSEGEIKGLDYARRGPSTSLGTNGR